MQTDLGTRYVRIYATIQQRGSYQHSHLVVIMQITTNVVICTGVGDGGRGSCPPPNSGEKIFFGQTSCNIRAVNIFLEKGRTYLTVFCFSFHVYVKYSFEFRNPFFYLFNIHSVILAAH